MWPSTPRVFLVVGGRWQTYGDEGRNFGSLAPQHLGPTRRLPAEGMSKGNRASIGPWTESGTGVMMKSTQIIFLILASAHLQNVTTRKLPKGGCYESCCL